MKALLCLWSLVLLGLFAPAAHAYPWMMRHEFAKCGTCHIDPMGGETLNHMGRVMGESLLSTSWGQAPPTDASRFLFGVPEPENVYLGGSLRGLSLVNFGTGKMTAFPMQADLTAAGVFGGFKVAGSVGVSRASSRYEHASDARVVGDVENEGVLLVSRNHWLGVDLTDALMLRLGRINLPFGVRSPEHTLWVRSETSTDRESDQQHGVSAVYDAGRIRTELMGVLGNFQRPGDAIRERGYSGYFEYLVDPTLALGVSSLIVTARREPELDRGSFVRHAHGFTARYLPTQPLMVLAEGNLLKKTRSGLGYVAMTTFDLEPIQGLHFAATGELLDRGEPLSGAQLGHGKPQLGGWLTANWFFGPHLDLRVDFVMRRGRGGTLQTQLHFYL